MTRTIYPKTKETKSAKDHFPLYKDSIYQSLTIEQQRFVYNIFMKPITNQKNYQCFLSATSRTIKKSTANTYTCELLKNPKIVHCIDKVKKHYRRQLRITPERILKEEASIAFADIVEFFDDEGYLVEKPSNLPKRVRAAISGFKRITIMGVEKYEVSLYNKGESLKRLQNIIGMNAPTHHKHNVAGTVGVEATIVTKIDLSGLDLEEIKALRRIQSKLGLGTPEEE